MDQSAAAKALDLVSEVFHRINRIIPEDQKVFTVSPNCLARNAIAEMKQLGYSQVPVVRNGEVLGVFSFRSFAQIAASATLEQWTEQNCAPGDLSVDEFLEHFEFSRVTEEMTHVFDSMDRDNGVLIGTPERLIGILTPMDFLRYLHKVASPFVMVSEIELALRELIRSALTEELLVTAAKRCLKGTTTLQEMTFANYASLIGNVENWAYFEPVFGGTRTRTVAKLSEIRWIRNDLFHFKRDITLKDHQTLANHRNWLLIKMKQSESYQKTENQL